MEIRYELFIMVYQNFLYRKGNVHMGRERYSIKIM